MGALRHGAMETLGAENVRLRPTGLDINVQTQNT